MPLYNMHARLQCTVRVAVLLRSHLRPACPAQSEELLGTRPTPTQSPCPHRKAAGDQQDVTAQYQRAQRQRQRSLQARYNNFDMFSTVQWLKYRPEALLRISPQAWHLSILT